MRRSSTRQEGRSGCGAERKSSADANVSTSKPAERRSRTSDLRTVLSLTPSRRAIADAVMPSLFKTVAPLEGRAAAQNTSSCRSRPISSHEQPSTSVRTSSVCCPNSGAGSRIDPGVSLSRTGSPTTCVGPKAGCSNAVT